MHTDLGEIILILLANSESEFIHGWDRKKSWFSRFAPTNNEPRKILLSIPLILFLQKLLFMVNKLVQAVHHFIKKIFLEYWNWHFGASKFQDM